MKNPSDIFAEIVLNNLVTLKNRLWLWISTPKPPAVDPWDEPLPLPYHPIDRPHPPIHTWISQEPNWTDWICARVAEDLVPLGLSVGMLAILGLGTFNTMTCLVPIVGFAVSSFAQGYGVSSLGAFSLSLISRWLLLAALHKRASSKAKKKD